MPNADIVGLRPRLFLAGRGHLFGAATINDGDVLRTQAASLRSRVDRRVAAADHHDTAPDRHPILRRLPQFGDELDGVAHPRHRLPRKPQSLDAGLTQTQEHGIKITPQHIERDVASERLAILDA